MISQNHAIRKLLIANRGEIAVRIIRTCQEMGIKTVAVYSTADAACLHVCMADEAICIGPPPSARSYLNANNIIMAALQTGSDAVHPGVGFLAENATFARQVEAQNLFFIGPAPETIALLGDKVKARNTAKRFELPLTPGTEGAVKDAAGALEAAKLLGFPLIIKAAAGGGGKGMRIVRSKAELAENLAVARTEALANFADGTVFIERYLENPRHVELQILADGQGGVAILGERDCSIQKNHQKLIEESPSPGVSAAMRERMCQGAGLLFRELNYRGAGTIEFLVEEENFYFMEVNTRIQVEHPVSELVTGVDIVKEQILCCTEGRMAIPPGPQAIQGCAMECRINARAPGMVKRLDIPGGPGVRFDSFLYTGYTVPPYYDSMIGKLIVHGNNREMVLARMERALRELVIEGIKTNIETLRRIIAQRTFRSGFFGTAYYETKAKEIDYAG
ncbi:MAG: acetyl-CoA carboxylase biotin carboxylase subunit [Spirochaetaceae bacterium]|nr:acetyl-CoA carboxylase biotin carboxylase subunit [Spirochaetaceae bacterium]